MSVCLAAAVACSGSRGAVTSPTAAVLTGQVTDSDTSAPIADASVSINGAAATVTDSQGRYSLAGGGSDLLSVSANDYEEDTHYIQARSQNVRLHRIERIQAGDSAPVTIAPDDTLCVNDIQDSPGLGQDYVCRTVRIVVPAAGILTIDALSAEGSRPPLEVEAVNGSPCCLERLANPASLPVTVGAEVLVHVEMPFGSTTSQSYIVATSITQ